MLGFDSRHVNLICRKLWRDELVLAVSPSHPWARRDAVAADQLAETPWILREQGSGTLKFLESYFHQTGPKSFREWKVQARLGSSTAVKEGIKSGLGVSILSRRAIGAEIEAGLLKTVKISGVSMTRSFYLVRNKLRIASPACQAMYEFLLATADDDS